MNNSLKNSLMALLPFLLVQALIGGSQGQLTAEDASEGPCLAQSELLPYLQKAANLVPVLTPGEFYIPMASQALYREYAEGLLGRPAATQEELEDMQIVLQCGPAFTTIVNKGYPQMEQPPSFGQTCTPLGLPSIPDLGLGQGEINLDYVQAVCTGLPATRPNGTVALVPSESFVTTVDSIVWVNEDESVLLAYRCPANGIKDFKVLSRTKTLDPSDIEQVKKNVLALGFSEDRFTYMTYE